MESLSLSIRPAETTDRPRLATLVHFERYVHRHLDWRSPLDWIGSSPYLLAENHERLVAALACPPDPPELAWIRLFAVSNALSPEAAWPWLWEKTLEYFNTNREVQANIAAIPLSKWFRELLEVFNFEQTDQVIVLTRTKNDQQATSPKISATIRNMAITDIRSVEHVDHAAFTKLWQISNAGLLAGYRESVVATVAELENQVIGYQMSTPSSNGGHLARLAVLPGYQGRGVGMGLLQDLLDRFFERGAQSVTVNTQSDNQNSIALYQRAGFKRTGEEYPVYQSRIYAPVKPEV